MRSVSRSYTLVKGSRMWRRKEQFRILSWMLKVCFPAEWSRVASCGKQSMKCQCFGRREDAGLQAYLLSLSIVSLVFGNRHEPASFLPPLSHS